MSECECCKEENSDLITYKGYKMCPACYMGYVRKVNVCENNVKYETEINQLKQENEKLFLQLSKQEIDEHKPVYCTLAGNDCKYLGKIKELKQQLAEKDKLLKCYQDEEKQIADILGDKDLTIIGSRVHLKNLIVELKNKIKDKDIVIEEKDKEIAHLKEMDNYHLLYELAGADETIANLKKQLEEKDKDQTQLAIQELSEVERLLYESRYKRIGNKYYVEYEDINSLIDSRIQALEELKGEKDAEG